MSPPNSVAINTYGIPGNGAIASTGGDGKYTNRGVPHDDRGHLDGARVEIISCECKLPAFVTRDPSEGPLPRGVLDQVPPYAKKDCNVKHEAKESGHPFLNANKARRQDGDMCVSMLSWRKTLTIMYSKHICSAE